jgi:hypothetical protein
MCGGFTLTIAERRIVAEMLGVDPDSTLRTIARGTISRRHPHFIVTAKYSNGARTVRDGASSTRGRDKLACGCCY